MTTTERLLPKLTFDFTTAPLDSRITFTRTTNATNPATYINSSGIITAATNNQPRFDYDPVTLVSKGLLIEGQRSNLFTYSEQIDNPAWAKSNSIVTANAIVAPDGALSGDKVFENTATAVHAVGQNQTAAASTAYTLSFFAKKAERTFAQATFGGGFNGLTINATFNLDTGVASVIAGVATASCVAVGNDWYRCVVTATSGVSPTSSTFRAGIALDASTVLYTGTTGSGIYIWGAQLEAGDFSTSYIPTTTTSLTRNADVAVITGTNFSDWWQTNRGGVVVRALPSSVSGIRPLVQFDDNTANNIIALRGNTTNPELYIVDGGTPQAQIDAGTIAANTAYSLTGWWQTNFCAVRKDNGARVEDLTATIPTVTQALLGSDGTNYLNGHLASINYYDQFSSQIYTRRKNKVVFTFI